MTWLVNISLRAQRDLTGFYEAIGAGQPGAARRWYEGLRRAILSLETMPHRCPVVRKRAQIRELLYGRKPNVYLVLYRIREKDREVDVLHIRHGARRRFSSSELR